MVLVMTLTVQDYLLSSATNEPWCLAGCMLYVSSLGFRMDDDRSELQLDCA